MTRGFQERARDVGRLLEAARAVHAEQARLAPAIARSTGLSPEGVALGFESLERDASPADLRALVDSAGDARHVHVILSANVFVAALRALAVARAAAPRVTVHPSSRDPVLARALVAAAGDPAITCVTDRRGAGADRIDVYGRDETIAAVKADVPGVEVRGHGAGLGVALVTSPSTEAAEALASDVVPFDQRGCLSPRVVLVAAELQVAEAFARALHGSLEAWGARVPRGSLLDAERSEAARWRDSMAFAGGLWEGEGHAVGLGPGDPRTTALAIPPPGRHVLVVPVSGTDEARAVLAPFARFVVTVGGDDAARVAAIAPPAARLSALGAMQRPPLDGPVDRRSV